MRKHHENTGRGQKPEDNMQQDEFKTAPAQQEQYVFMSVGPGVTHYGYHLGTELNTLKN